MSEWKMNLEACAAIYEKNRHAFMSYRWRRGRNLPSWEDLDTRAVQVGETEYAWRIGDGLSAPVKIQRTQINTRPLFRDLSKPLLVHNEMNSYHWEYLMDNVRASEDYGGDNHVYMHYDSLERFLLLLQVVDITPYLASEKFVFLFGERERKECYPLDFQREYGIDYDAMPAKPVRLEEIQRFVFDWMEGGANGNVFFAGVFDYHPNLLTMGELSMGGFPYLYEHLLKGNTVDEAIHAIETTMDGKAYIEPYWMYRRHFASGDIPYPDREQVVHFLRQWFSVDYCPTKMEWIKALYLAYSMALGRDLNQRIAPAIVFHHHAYYMGYPAGDMYDVFREFKYFRSYTPLRRPTVTLGRLIQEQCTQRFSIYAYPGSYLYFFQGLLFDVSLREHEPQHTQLASLYLPPDDEFLPYRGVVRFEDMKLQPRATAEALCDFLDIPWDDILLSVTVNGAEGNMGDVRGFDTRPVFRRYETYVSPFDYYRLEVALGDTYAPWGYRPRYHTDGVSYSREEILSLFQVRFKCEDYLFTLHQQKDNVLARKKVNELLKEFLSIPPDQTKDGKKLVPIPWIQPKEEFMDGELYG